MPANFWSIGIAAPHPDRYGQPSLDGATGEPFSGHYGDGFLESLCPAELGDDLRYGVSPRNLPKPGQTLPYHFVATLTPPAQHGDVDWRSLATVTAAGMESPATDPGHSESQPEDARVRILSCRTPSTHPLITNHIGAAALAARVLMRRGADENLSRLLIDVAPVETSFFGARTPSFSCYSEYKR